MDGILSVKTIRSLACTVLAGELAVRVTLLDVRLFSYDRYTLIVDRLSLAIRAGYFSHRCDSSV